MTFREYESMISALHNRSNCTDSRCWNMEFRKGPITLHSPNALTTMLHRLKIRLDNPVNQPIPREIHDN